MLQRAARAAGAAALLASAASGHAPPLARAASAHAAAAPTSPSCAAPPGWTVGPISSHSDPKLGGRIVNTSGVAADGSFRWNGEPIGAEEMARYMGITQQMTPRPAILLYPLAGASCEAISKAVSLVEKQFRCDPGLCYLVYDPPPALLTPPSPPAPPPPPPRLRR
ncbi:MAG TPA: hypothetical protein VF727_14980 [Allosphingosinicella sp.]|jgi:hypothetical protein